MYLYLLFALLTVAAIIVGGMFYLSLKSTEKEGAHIPTGIVVPRVKIPLDGLWDFKIDPNIVGESKSWYIRDNFADAEKIEVPFCWQSQFPELRDYHGFAWYQRVFNISKTYSGCRVVLHIGAVNYDPKIWVNDKLVGEFRGGYYPLEVDLTDFVEFGGDNVLTIRVYHPDPVLIDAYPHGKQTWYSFVGGIWQSTYIEITSGIYISDVFVIPDVNDSKAEVIVAINNLPKSPMGFSIDLKLTSPEGEVIEKEFDVEENKVKMEINVPKMLLWTLDKPQLYNVTTTLKKDGKPLDEVEVTTGFRKVEAKNGKIYLNGKPIYLRGVLNQAFYPKTIYTPPSDEFIKNELELAKRMGINLVRIHVKVADPRYLDWADKLGILIWEEPPNVGSFTVSAEERLTETFRQMILRDRNHPSIIIWGIINEAWGVDPSTSRGREWLIKMYDLAKDLDPTRLVVDNSACGGNYHVKTDIDDFHWYNTIPGSYKEWIGFVRRYATDPSWTFGNNPVRKGDEPLIVSEFGVWGMPSLRNITESYGGEPWWFSKGWGSGIPKGAEERFNAWNLREVWTNWEEFAVSSQWRQFQALKFMIEEIRKYPQISGYIITEFYDLYWECNGLLDFYRNPKAYIDNLTNINNDDLLIIDRANSKTNLWSGENFTAPVYFSKWSEGKLNNAKLKWNLDDVLRGEIVGVNVSPYGVTDLGSISFIAPNVSRVTKLALTAELVDSEDNLIATNSINLVVAPKEMLSPRISKETSILIYSPDGTLKRISDKLREMECNVTVSDVIDKKASIVITSTYDDEVRSYVKSGGKVLIIPSSLRRFCIEDKCYEIANRGGEWVTDFHYIRNKEIFEGLPIENPMEWTYYLTMPNRIIRGVSQAESENIDAGYFEGWIHQHAATIFEKATDGEGLIIISTYDFSRYGEDPVTTILLNNLLGKLTPLKHPKD
jgi:hypothetical protein